jgi:hypothetical protein
MGALYVFLSWDVEGRGICGSQEFFYAADFREVPEPFEAAFALQDALSQCFDR